MSRVDDFAAAVGPQDPLVVPGQGRQVRVRRDDARLGPLTQRAAIMRLAIELAPNLEGLRLVLASALGDRYVERISDDAIVVGLRRY